MTNSVITESSGGGLTGHEMEYQHDLVQSDITADSTVTNSVITECSGGEAEYQHDLVQSYVATNSAVTNSIYAEKSSAGFIGSQLGYNQGLF